MGAVARERLMSRPELRGEILLAEHMYVVMKLLDWEMLTLTPSVPLPWPIVMAPPDDGQPTGFLPVFATIEQAREWAADDTYEYEIVTVRKADTSGARVMGDE